MFLRYLYTAVFVNVLLSSSTARADDTCNTPQCVREGVARSIYAQLRAQPPTPCKADLLPRRLEFISAESLNAHATLSQKDDSPRIVINRGLLEFSDAASFLFSRLQVANVEKPISPDKLARKAVAEVANLLLFKAQHPYEPLSNSGEMPPKWTLATRHHAWQKALRSRLYFFIAHEMAHHCYEHLRKLSQTQFIAMEVALTSGKKVKMKAAVAHGASDKDRQKMESDADNWALDLVLLQEESLNIEAAARSIAELAILDGAASRLSSEDNALRYTHPVSLERFQVIVDKLNDDSEGVYPTLGRLQNIVLCLEYSGKNKIARLQRYAGGGQWCDIRAVFKRAKQALAKRSSQEPLALGVSAVAVGPSIAHLPLIDTPATNPKASARVDPMAGLASVTSLPIRASETAARVSLSASSPAKFTIRRLVDSEGAARQFPLSARADAFTWSAALDKDEEYVLTWVGEPPAAFTIADSSTSAVIPTSSGVSQLVKHDDAGKLVVQLKESK